MRQLHFALFMLFCSVQVTAQQTYAQKIITCYERLLLDSSYANQLAYFESFPSSFQSFEAIFGFDNGQAHPLYEYHMAYIPAFFHLESIPLETQMKKWIGLGINGHWDADNVYILQSLLYRRTLQHTELAYSVLLEKTDEEIESYFYFLFDSVHPHILTIPEEFEALKQKDAAFYGLIQRAHIAVMSRDQTH